MLNHSVRVGIGLLALMVFAGGCRQPKAVSLDRQLIGEVLMCSELSANLRTLAMPGGRLSGSPNGRKAERFVAGKAARYGLSNVHFEPFEMTTWQDRRTTVVVLGDPPQVLEGALALGNSLSTVPEGISAAVVDVGIGLEKDFQAHAHELEGKFALVREGGIHRGAKMRLACEHGAVGLVQVSRLDDRVRVGTCHAKPRPEPGITIKGSDGKALTQRLQNGETVRINVKIDADAWVCQPNNVVAEIPGAGPSAHEVVILCAHLDSWHLAEGALDNGTGATAILEAARALVRLRWKPNRTVRLIWFMGEEHGLHGSKAYVRDHADQLDNIVAVINVDMPGAPRKFITFGHPEIVKFLQSFQKGLAGFELNEEVANATWTASDHAAFMKQGVCALSLSGEMGPGVKYYHSTGDTYDQVDRRATIRCAAVLAVLVRQLADCSARPTVRLDPEEPHLNSGW
ncbi:MAG: M20/M25/M40 family metallo-hydrolase [Phycisphaerae bacterium]|nr:M20/M25/M40 family metallo-hydrolase [Phycisphaerae bacterium]